MKILVTEDISEQGLDILRASSFQVDVRPELAKQPEALSQAISSYDALLVRSLTKVSRELIEHAHHLKIIGRAGVGVDNVDVLAATQRGILVVNSPEGNTIAAAEHAFALILSLVRHLPNAAASLRRGEWNRKHFTGVELYGKRLGVVGLGKIGARVASYGLAFGMEVIGFDPYVSPEYAEKLGFSLVSQLDDLFKQADIITFHIPLTKETRHVVNTEKLALMKTGVRLVNAARGGLIDEVALIEAIQSGKVAGASLDVFEQEPLPATHPFLKLPQVVAVPHLGASTVEAQVNVAVDVATQMVEVLKGGVARSAVNIPSMRPDLLAPVQPYFRLAERLGLLAAQLVDGAVRRVDIAYHGEIAAHDVAPLTTALIKGLLEPILQDTVNYVNAALVAKQRKIQIAESKTTELKDFANLITVKVVADGEERSISGSLFGTAGERIVHIDGFKVDTEPEGYLLIAPNLDKPGMIGKIGTILGNEQINIASMDVGRKSSGGRAVMVLNVDSAVPDRVLDQIQALDGIYSVRLVKLS